MSSYKMPSGDEILLMLLWIFLAGYGGAMSYLMRSVERNEKPKFWRAMLEFGTAVSIGTVIMLLCAAMEWSTLWTGVVVSASGWIGAKGVVSIIEAIVLKRAGLTRDDIKE